MFNFNNAFLKHPNPENTGGSLEKQKPREFPEYVHKYFSSELPTKEFRAARKFFDYCVIGGNLPEGVNLYNDGESINKIKEIFNSKLMRTIPGTDIDEVIQDLIKYEILIDPPKEKKIKEEIVPEHVTTEFIELAGATSVEISEEELELVEANLLLEEIKRKNVFSSPTELETLYARVMLENKQSGETLDYYKEFTSLVKGGESEILSDFKSLEERKRLFESQKVENVKSNKKIEQAKQIATLTECALEKFINTYQCYGEHVAMVRTSEFDDVKRGVDDVLEIKREGNDSDFLGLGIDVTFRGIESEEFKDKFFKLLRSIYDGYQTKIKYFKDDQGNCKKEFTVPKMVLYFNVDDVRDMMDVLRYNDENKFHNDYQKENIMNQIVHSCKKLAKFAEDNKKPVFREYYKVINSLKELSFNDSRISELIEVEHTDKISLKFDELISEFKDVLRAEKEINL